MGRRRRRFRDNGNGTWSTVKSRHTLRTSRKYLVWQWQERRCYLCGRTVKVTIKGKTYGRGVPGSFDHVIPRHAGGHNSLGNRLVACQYPCDMADKCGRMPYPCEMFLAELAYECLTSEPARTSGNLQVSNG